MSEKPLEKETAETVNSSEGNDNNDQDVIETIDETISFEETSSEPQPESGEAEREDGYSEGTEEDLVAKVDQLQAELNESANRYLRLQADYDNFRRRTREEKSQERKLRAQELVQDILPVLDNFKRALDVEVTSEETSNLKQGLEMVYRQLNDALKKEGVEEVESINQPFDPNLHQAVMQEEVEGVDPNTIVDVFQAGYVLNGRVIRPAMVKVSS